MSKGQVRQSSVKPFRFLRELMGAQKVQIEEGRHIFRLGKKCLQCGKQIMHSDSISVCQCYCFAHKECLKQQLKQANVSECTVVQCKQCKGKVEGKVSSRCYFKLNYTFGDLIVLFICAALCVASINYLVNLKNTQNQEMKQEEIRTSKQNSESSINIQQVISLSVLLVFGTLLSLCLLGIVLNKQPIVMDIVGTNTQIKVSAFEQIEVKIRQQSQHKIVTRKGQLDM